MLAALLCNLTQATAVTPGPILRGREYSSVSADVRAAAEKIEALMFPSSIPGAIKVPVKRSLETIKEISALPEVMPAFISVAAIKAREALSGIQSFINLTINQPFEKELLILIDELQLIAYSLNDDEEALLLLI